jgi:hypothetical protein
MSWLDEVDREKQAERKLAAERQERIAAKAKQAETTLDDMIRENS